MVEGKIHYINNIKSFLALLVIVFHTNSAYGGEGGWYYVEPTNDVIAVSILTLINALCQSFFMGLFFFISAYFSPKSYDKKGFYTFLKGRISKLLIPAFFLFLCFKSLMHQYGAGTRLSLIIRFLQHVVYCSFVLFYVDLCSWKKNQLSQKPKMGFSKCEENIRFYIIHGRIRFYCTIIFSYQSNVYI